MATTFAQLKRTLFLSLIWLLVYTIHCSAQNIYFGPKINNFCKGDTVTISYTAGCPVAGATYNWTFSGGTPSTATGPGPQMVQWSTLGTHTVTVIETNGACSHTVNKSIIINGVDSSQSAFNMTPTSVCVGQQTILAYTGGLDPSVYQLNLNYGLTATPDFNYPTFPDTIPLTWSTPGVFTTHYYVQDPFGDCPFYTTTIIVTVNANPSDTFTYLSATCLNQATVQLIGTPSPSATYFWDFSGGTAVPGTGAGPQSVTWPIAGAYNVSLSVADTTGCNAGPYTLPVTVQNGTAPTSTFVSASITCNSSPVIVSYTGNAGLGDTYNWNFDGGTATPGTGQGPQSVSWPTAGIKTITLSVDNGSCISALTSQTVHVNNMPTSTFTVDAQTVCIDTSSTFTYTGNAPGTATFLWLFNGANTRLGIGEGPQTVSWPDTGTYLVVLSVNENGCASSVDSQWIKIIDCQIPGKCSFGYTLTPEATLHTWDIIYTSNGKQPITYTWNWGDGTSSTGDTATHVYDTAGYYTICATLVDDSGCTSTFCDSSTYLFRMDGNNTMVTVHVGSSPGTVTATPMVSTAKQVVSLYPNPCSEQLTVSSNQLTGGLIEITNVLGSRVLTLKAITEENVIDVSQLNPGVYFLSVKYVNGGSDVRKFVKE